VNLNDVCCSRDWQQWLMMGLIGFTVGLIGFVMHQLIDLISNFKWSQATDYLNNVSSLLLLHIIYGITDYGYLKKISQ
jgi:chloride channel 7